MSEYEAHQGQAANWLRNPYAAKIPAAQRRDVYRVLAVCCLILSITGRVCVFPT